MKTPSLLTAALFAFATAASAQSYGVLSIGTAKLSVDCAGTSTCDKTDTAFKIIGGYKFNPNLAVELGYFDFGKAKATASGIKGEIGNTAVGVGLAFHQDLAADWNFVARLGGAQMKTKIRGTLTGVASNSDSDNNIVAYGGLGVGYKMTKTVTLGAAWDFSKSKYNKQGLDESGNLNAYGLNLTVDF
jgi:OmpA-OmpF porin, OOP family